MQIGLATKNRLLTLQTRIFFKIRYLKCLKKFTRNQKIKTFQFKYKSKTHFQLMR